MLTICIVLLRFVVVGLNAKRVRLCLSFVFRNDAVVNHRLLFKFLADFLEFVNVDVMIFQASFISKGRVR